MFLWFLVLAPILVAEVFRSPMMDLRVVGFAAMLPVFEIVSPTPLYLHTMVCPLVVLTVVMLSTMNRRLIRRRLLGLPIGLLMHLVLDATWRTDRLLLWPFFGRRIDNVELPEASMPLPVGLLLEVLAIVAAVWAYGRYDLSDSSNRLRLMRAGQLNRAVFR